MDKPAIIATRKEGSKKESACTGKNATCAEVFDLAIRVINRPLAEHDGAIPLYDASAAGFSQENSKLNSENSQFVAVAASTLNSCRVQLGHAICIKARGSFMGPVLPDGAIVAVDTGNKMIKDGQMYGIRREELLMIRRLYRLPGKMLRLSSFNDRDPAYGDEIVSASEMEVSGYVFGWFFFRESL